MKIEINKEETEELIDWYKPQLLHDGHSDIVLSTGVHYNNSFEGVSITCTNSVRFLTWEKKAFKLYKGSITLSND